MIELKGQKKREDFLVHWWKISIFVARKRKVA